MAAVVAPALLSAAIAASQALPWLAAATFVKTFAISLAMGGLSRALSPKPKKAAPGVQPVNSHTLSIRQPAETRKYVYGHTRVADVYAHMVGEGDNDKLHAIAILCSNELTAIDEVWVNDYAIPSDWIDADGNVTQGRYSGYLRIRKHLGSVNQVADSVAVGELADWTVNHRMQGISYLFLTLTKNQDVYPTGLPNFSAIVRGKSVFDPRSGSAMFTSNIALFCYDYLSRASYGFGTSDVDLDNISAQANICDEIVDTAEVAVLADSIDTATDIITLDGDLNKFQWGDRVEVSGSGIPGGLAADTAYYVIIYQVKDTPRIKLASSLAHCFSNVAIDITSSGSGVTVTKTGEPRYHGAGVLDSEETLEDNFWGLLNSMAGRAYYSGGEWKLRAGAYSAPDVEFTISDMIGEMSVRTKIPANERFNLIKGLYTSSLNNYQPDDYPVKRVQSFVDADNGVEYPREFNLPYTNRATTAQRITKIELLKSRQEMVFSSTYNMKGATVETGDTVELTVDRYGWAQKKFEVTGFTFNVTEDAKLATSLTLRETDESVYDYTSAEDATIDPAPNSNLPSAFNVLAVTGLAYSSRQIDTQDGDLVYELGLQWDLHSNAFVREYGDFEIQYKLSADIDWLPSFFVDGSLTASGVVTSSVNTSYDLRMRARNNLGVRSNWNTILNAIVGTSGGVGSTEDWGEWVSSPGSSEDWEDFSGAPGSTEDWGFYT